MLLKLFQKERRINDLWAIILLIISLSTAITLSYLNQDKESLPDLYSILSCFFHWEIFTTFCLYLCIYSCAIGLLYFYTVPIMHMTPILYFFAPPMTLYFAGDSPYIFFGSSCLTIFILVMYFFIVRDNIKYAGPVIKLSIRIILKQLPVILLAILPILSLVILLVIQMYLSLTTFSWPLIAFMVFNLIWSVNLIYYFTYVFISSLVCFDVKCRKGYYFNALVNTLYSIGSLALAGLLLIFIELLRILFSSFSSKNNGLFGFCCILTTIGDAISALINYLNEWAFVYIALLGTNYISACNKAIKDLCNNLIIKIVNNKSLFYVLSFINLGIYLIFHIMCKEAVLKLIGAVGGLLFTIYISLAFDSANKTLLILYTEDKDALNAVYGNIVKVLDMQVADNIR